MAIYLCHHSHDFARHNNFSWQMLMVTLMAWSKVSNKN